MASRFWVGGTGTWDTTTTTHWSTTSGGAGGASVPTTADDVFLDGNSGGGTVTWAASNALVCNNFNTTGFTGTMVATSTGTLTVGGSTLTLGASMTGGGITSTGNLALSRNGVITVTSNGKTLPQITVQSFPACELSQADAMTLNGAFTLSNGKWTTNNFSATFGTVWQVVNNTNPKVLNWGSSTITVAGTGAAFSLTSTTVPTISANTATLNFTSGQPTISLAGVNLNGASLVITGSSSAINLSAGTMANLTINWSNSKFGQFLLTGDITVTGTAAFNGFSTTVRMVTMSSLTGTPRTITAGTVTAQNADFCDIIGAGAANWDLSAIPGGSGDCQGNSGITFTPRMTLYRVNESSSTHTFSDVNRWSRVSGAASNLVLNPTAEVDNSQWTANAVTSIVRSTAQAYSGAASLLVTWSANASQGAEGQLYSQVVIGQTYTMQARVYVPSGSPDVALAAKGLVGNSGWVTTKDAWTLVTYTWVANSALNVVQVLPRTFSTGTQVYVDEVQVELGSVANPFVIATGRVPLPQDDVVIDNGTSTLNINFQIDMPRACRNIDWSGYTGAGSVGPPSPSIATTIYGSWVQGSTVFNATMGGNTITFAGRGTQTLTFNNTFNVGVGVNAGAGSYTLLTALTINSNNFTLSSGTFDATGRTITLAGLVTNGTVPRQMIGGNWITTNLAATVVWSTSVNGLTVIGSPNITISGASANTRTMGLSTFTYGTITYTVAASTGILAIGGSGSTFALATNSGKTVQFGSNSTFNITGWSATGQSNGYLYLPGVNGNNVTTPDSAAVSVTGDLDVRALVALDNWVPGVNTEILSKRGASASDISYALRISSTGKLEFVSSVNGTVALATDSTANPGGTNGSPLWIRATRVAATGVHTFYTSPDGVTWTQLGTTVTNTAGAIFDSVAALEIGSSIGGTANPLAGKVYRVQVLNGIGGTVAFDADFTAKPFGANTFTEGSSNAATVTVNGALAQTGDGRLALLSNLAGTQARLRNMTGAAFVSDYLSVKDLAAQNSAGATVAGLWYAGANSTDAGNNTGWSFTAAFNSFVVSLSDGSSTTDALDRVGAFAPMLTDGVAASDALVRVRAASRNLAEVTTAAELLSLTASTARALAETATGADVLGRTTLTARAVADATSVTETLARLFAWQRVLANAVAGSAALDRVVAAARSVGDGHATADVLTSAIHGLVGLGDGVSGVDVLAREAGRSRSVADAHATNDAGIASGRTYARALADATALDDAAARLASSERATSDTVTGAASPALLTGYARSVHDFVTAADAVTLALAFRRSASNAVTGADTLGTSIGALRLLAEALTTLDVLTDVFVLGVVRGGIPVAVAMAAQTYLVAMSALSYEDTLETSAGGASNTMTTESAM